MRDCGAKALFVHTDLFQQIRDGIPSDVSVLALRLHSLTIEEPATRVPDGRNDWEVSFKRFMTAWTPSSRCRSVGQVFQRRFERLWKKVNGTNRHSGRKMSDAIFIVNRVSGDLTIGDKREIDKATWRKPRGIRLTPTSRYIRDRLFPK
jgi:hypothetical protein